MKPLKTIAIRRFLLSGILIVGLGLNANSQISFIEVLDANYEGVGASSIAFSDVDGDGDEDVLITGLNSSGTPISNLYTNDGGNFTLVEDTPFTGVNVGSIAFSDVDGDGDEDVLITGRNSGNPFFIYSNLYANDGGNFTLVEDTPFEGVRYSSTAFSDVDGDGDEDVLITGQNAFLDPSANLYTNDGGTFTLVEDTPFDEVRNSSIAFSDVDGDGDEDVLITGQNSSLDRISNLYTNDGGNFTLVEDTPFEDVVESSIAFSDVDGDGDEDVLITGVNTLAQPTSNLYANDGGGNFTLLEDTPFIGVFWSSIAFSDVDGDGDEDVLITGNSTAGIISNPSVISNLYANDGGGNFTLVEDTPFSGVYSGSIAFSDVDEDGDEDVLITGFVYNGYRTAKLYLNITGQCDSLFPAVYESSLSTTFQGNSYLVEWDPVPGQIACQGQLLNINGEQIKIITFFENSVSSAVIPGSLLEYGTTYAWRVRCGCSVDPLIAGPFSTWQVFTTPAGAAIASSPNPTAGPSNVTFTVVEEGTTTLEVFDLSGRLIDGLFNGIAMPNNDYRFMFDGSSLPNGVYIYRLTTEREIINEKFMIAR
ncbi:FG-GAP-like repeat-containing protein [Cryomorphaceae bacterium 1068]|nr:FG-GAP-like repeat-containing protein [Cryomorphaceae bacterium 1068]